MALRYPYLSVPDALLARAAEYFVRGVIYFMGGNPAFALGCWRKSVRKMVQARRIIEAGRWI